MKDFDKDERDKIVDFNRYREDNRLNDEWLDYDDDDEEDFSDYLERQLEILAKKFQGWHRPSDLTYAMYRSLADNEKKFKGDVVVDYQVEILRERDSSFLHGKFSIAKIAKKNGLYGPAIDQFLEIYRMDKSDYLASRRELMALYALSYRYEEAKNLYLSKTDYADDIYFLLPLFMLTLLADNLDEANQYLEQLDQNCPDWVNFYRDEAFPLADVMKVSDMDDMFDEEDWEVKPSDLYLAFGKMMPLVFSAHAYIHSYLKHYYEEKDNHSK